MPDMLMSALVQAPFVLVMAYLVHRFLTHLSAHDEDWRRFMECADEQFGERLAELTRSVERLTELVVNHDAAVRGALRTNRKLRPSPQEDDHSLRMVRGE